MPSERHDINAPLHDEFASPDLELLAEQLRSDAEHLAARYPARRLNTVQESLQQRTPPRRVGWTRFARGIASRAAAALLAIGCGWWGFTGSYHATQLAGPGPEVSWAEQPVPATMPASLFFDLTGPEKEAVLDLFEKRALAQGSLSI